MPSRTGALARMTAREVPLGKDISGALAVSARGSRLEYIPALDGIRALAVGLVMAYHLDLSIVRGGFLGVDLFFVLSGFLITTLLLREYGRSGRIDLRAFWMRRARRLLPALFLLLAAVAIAAGRASAYEQGGLRWDLLSALGYVANWRFIAGGQSYFQQFVAPSPVRHLWSLSIEEQFYVIWPLLTLAALWFASKAKRAGILVIGLLGLAIAASGVSLAVAYNEADPSAAYFATHTRAHELLIGAAGCVLVERSIWVRNAVGRIAPLLAVLGLAAILAFGVLLSDASSLYYFGGSTIFALAALAAILGISTRQDGNWAAAFMSLRPLPAIGAISYGLYLWHWPLFNWLTTESTGLSGPALDATRVLATLVVATGSFVIVERPIRQGHLGRWRIGLRATVAGAVSAALMLAILTLVETRGARPIPEFVDNNRQILVVNAPHSIGAWAIVGDSTAMALYPGLAVEAADRSRTLVVAAFPGCPVGQAERVDADGQPFPWGATCPPAVRTGYRTAVERFDPSLVFWLSSTDRYSIRVGGQTLAAGTDAWREALFADWTRALGTLTSNGAHVVLILPMHRQGADPRDTGGQNPLRTIYRQWAAQHEDTITVIDPDPVVCPQAPCPSRIGNVDLYQDKVHLTHQASLIVAKELFDLLPNAIKNAS
jgi:peptidoglycan/LPS O-acetylase OafA/YrhL